MTRKCYICGRTKAKKAGDWFYVPPVHTGKPPKDLVLCKEHAREYMDMHYSWKNVKRTITALKKEK